MVSVIVLLLTAVILFRSFERAKNSANVRVSTVVLNAATPAVDRARAKIGALLQDPTLPQGTPTEISLYTAIQRSKYTLPDETAIELAYDINGDGTIETTPPSDTTYNLQDDETLESGWKFAVDTDNNGKDDTITLYSIQFRSPPTGTDGNFDRQRNPLEARTPPMNSGTNSSCSNASGFSTIVGTSGWYQLASGDLAKSFFAYVVNVPITQALYTQANLATATAPDGKSYEVYKGDKGVIALEFQQDRSLVPLPNNAVWFKNDLESYTGQNSTFYLNGRIHTNANLLLGSSGTVELFEVSSIHSCFYNEQNGEISVGGNVGNGVVYQTSDYPSVAIDLYQGANQTPTSSSINSTNKSVNSSGGYQIGFNDAAYAARINQMLSDGIALCTACANATNGQTYKTAVAATGYPQDVISGVNANVQNTDTTTTAASVLSSQIQLYLQNRTRQVPYAEVPDPTGLNATTGYTGIGQNSAISDILAPPPSWSEPLDSSNNLNGTSISLNTAELQETYPVLQAEEGTETYVGDRIAVGNNLPAYWVDGNEYVTTTTNQLISNGSTPIYWTAPTSNQQQRWRNTQIQAATNIGISNRNGFWEEAAATIPSSASDSVGGLRIVTGAGIYVDDGNSLINTNGNGAKYTIPPTAAYSRCGGSTSCPYATAASSSVQYSFLPTPPAPIPAPEDGIGSSAVPLPYISVWPDTMPMTDVGNTTATSTSNNNVTSAVNYSSALKDALRGDLLMRASVVYHYASNAGQTLVTEPNSNLNNDNIAVSLTPVACISSYYDPTTNPSDPSNVVSSLNKNRVGSSGNSLPWNYAGSGKIGRSNNGIVYPFPGRSTYATYQTILQRQALLIFPNGRWANQALQNALSTVGSATDLTSVTGLQQSDYSAIDAALCSLYILNNEDQFSTTLTNLPPHGAIKEATILDGREERQNGSLATSYAALGGLASYCPTPTSSSYPPPPCNSGTSYPYIYSSQTTSNQPTFTISSSVNQGTTSQTSFLTNYDLDLELRQPMEVRLTDIDLGVLAKTVYTVSSGGCDSTGKKEYFLPCSGIIYATRDDALPDASALPGFYLPSGSTDSTSPTDFQLDPTRRPNGIRLIDGESLARDPSNNKNNYVNSEKGLILVTNLPAYVRATGSSDTVFSSPGNEFNVHETSTGNTSQIQEFTQQINSLSNYNYFYTRSTQDTNFACRVGRTGCTTTTTGDYWRPATIIADAMTLLSGTFVDGYRGDSDYDLNNNTGRAVEANFIPATISNTVSPASTSVYSNLDPSRGSRLQNGYWESYYVGNAAWDTNPVWNSSQNPNSHIPNVTSSYLLNGISPIQRRLDGPPTYVMEICRKMLISSCGPTDWVIGFDINGDGTLSNQSQSYSVNSTNVTLTESQINSTNLGQAIAVSYSSNNGSIGSILPSTTLDWDKQFTSEINGVPSPSLSIRQRLGAGDTAAPALQTSQYYSYWQLTAPTSVPTTDQFYPRRVAFARNNNTLIGSNGVYQPLGINCSLDTTANTPANNSNNNGCTGTNYGKAESNALWFISTSGQNYSAPLFYYPPVNSTGEPLLAPVLHHYAYSNSNYSGGGGTFNNNGSVSDPSYRTIWIQQAPNVSVSSTFNAAFAVGNSPSRVNESSAAIQNFVRFLEDWNNANNSQTPPVYINGSFLQIQRSAYATAPTAAVLTQYNTNNGATSNSNFSLYGNSFFTYPTQNSSGQLPHYYAPNRAWGFDVAILGQQPDLFAQRFTNPTSGSPNEFFREVDRTDPWVDTLLCAVQSSGSTNVSAINGSEYLPSNCPTPTNVPAPE